MRRRRTVKKTEMIKIFAVLTAAYPKFDTFQNPEQLKPIIEIWSEMFEDVEFSIALVAVKKLILESPFPPSIADVRKQVSEILTPEVNKIDAGQAWGEVMRAVKNYGFYDPEGALKSMSPITREVVKRISWREICMQEEEKMGVLRGQFIKIYDTMAKRQKQDALLPLTMQAQIRQISESFGRVKVLEAAKEVLYGSHDKKAVCESDDVR